MPSWLDRCIAARDRLLSSPQFQRRAAGLPFARLIARRRARELFDLCAGFVYSQIVFACVKLELFALLAEGPQDAATLAQRLGLPESGMLRLLEAAKALRLVEERSAGRYGLGVLGAAIVGNPGIAAMVLHHSHLYADLCDPVALLRGERGATQVGSYWPYAASLHPSGLPSEAVASYSTLMALSQPLVADEVLDAYSLDHHRCLLDVGGGEGAFLEAVAARTRDLRMVLFDLPAVAERARARLAARDLGRRVTVVGGDFFIDPLPRADALSLNRVILDHDDAGALHLLQAAYVALEPGGTLIVAEPMADAPGQRGAAAYFNLYLLAMGRGRPRTRAELSALIQRAGFGNVHFRRGRRLMQTGVITANS